MRDTKALWAIKHTRGAAARASLPFPLFQEHLGLNQKSSGREKPAKARKAGAFLAFAGARLIGGAKGPVKPISQPHSTPPARGSQTTVPALPGRAVTKHLTDSDRPPPVRRRPELNYRHGVGQKQLPRTRCEPARMPGFGGSRPPPRHTRKKPGAGVTYQG